MQTILQYRQYAKEAKTWKRTRMSRPMWNWATRSWSRLPADIFMSRMISTPVLNAAGSGMRGRDLTSAHVARACAGESGWLAISGRGHTKKHPEQSECFSLFLDFTRFVYRAPTEAELRYELPTFWSVAKKSTFHSFLCHSRNARFSTFSELFRFILFHIFLWCFIILLTKC